MPRKKTSMLYHAMMTVTRIEEWCVEAKSLEEARSLLESGRGHRCHSGEYLDTVVEQMIDEAA